MIISVEKKQFIDLVDSKRIIEGIAHIHMKSRDTKRQDARERDPGTKSRYSHAQSVNEFSWFKYLQPLQSDQTARYRGCFYDETVTSVHDSG